jgi:recombination associated protein RdgC
MWFKNLRVYRLGEDWTLTPEELNEQLASQAFNPCGKLDTFSYGFVPPLGRHGSELVHATNGFIMVCAKRQEKILPSAVVKEHLEEKVLELSQAEARKIGRAEKQTLKDEIIFSLLPKAFSKSSLDFAYLSPADRLIVINTSSAKRAEDLLSALREALGSLKALPLTPKSTPTQVMTHWLRDGHGPSGIVLGEECELQAGKDGRIIRCKHLDLSSDELRQHLDTGMHATKLAICWQESLHCLLDDNFAIKRVKFEDQLINQAGDRNPESPAEAFDAEFAIMTLELQKFLRDLLRAFGGEADSHQEQ